MQVLRCDGCLERILIESEDEITDFETFEQEIETPTGPVTISLHCPDQAGWIFEMEVLNA